SISSIDINRAAVGQLICFTEAFFSLRYNNNVLYQFSFFKKDAEPFTRLSRTQSERWWQILRLLEQERNIASKGSDKVVRSYLNILLYELERMYRHTPIILVHNLKMEKVQQLEQLIEQHYTEKKRPSDYASLLCISPNYLNKICKEETGLTAGELIRKRIIIEAQRLLYYTNYSVNEVANKLGFDNASYFVTFFKKNTNQTTEQFRKNQYT
ncbi:MAG: helix-turn-helix domain-containing protein, partial [Chitinophagia bacterium]|nr:helix-turn-helix domain-containing protein [Chitinophagia bacterium]